MDPTTNPYSANQLSPYAQQASPLDLLRKALMTGASGYTGQNQQQGQLSSPTSTGLAGGGSTPNYNQFGNSLGTALGKTVQSLMQSSPSAAQPLQLQPQGLGGYEGNVSSPANPFDAQTGVFGMPAASSSAGANIPLPQPRPQNPFAFGTNPTSPDAMTQALMAPPVSSASFAGAVPDAVSMLML